MRRTSMTSLSSVDADLLIKNVQDRPAIWDRRNEGNKNKAYIEDIWSELEEIHGVSSKYKVMELLYFSSIKILLVNFSRFRRFFIQKSPKFVKILFLKCLLWFFFPEKLLKLKWKGLRDNFRCHWKNIPRNESGLLLMKAEDYKWV